MLVCWEMLVYIGIMLVGFFYVWKKGALDWGHSPLPGEANLMPLQPAITDLEELKNHPAGPNCCLESGCSRRCQFDRRRNEHLRRAVFDPRCL